VSAEAHLEFACFGGSVAIHVRGVDYEDGLALAERGREVLLDAHRRLSRFDPDSELCRLNRDPRAEVPASPLMRRLAAAVRTAGFRSGGLVDATLVDAIEQAGYTDSLQGGGNAAPLARSIFVAADPAPAAPNPAADWRAIEIDEAAGTVVRPPGLRIDGGGLAKGLLADLVGGILSESRSFAVNCCGDIRLGGKAGARRSVRIDDPFGTEPLHELSLSEGAAATSGISRRSWTVPGGRLAHQILDPRTGRPAFTGILQATAIAPNALLAEVLAKSALLSGPVRGADWLPFGGVLVPFEGEHIVVAAKHQVPETSAA
jgi:thiamine biosynthesis lipoprotein